MKRCFFLLLLAVVLAAGPARARVVGLVLDDSGSMIPIFERALFAVQLLAAVLDEEDQLYVARLNGDQGRVIGPIDLASRQDYMEQIRTQWRSRNKDPTHYPPLERTLEKLVAATPAGEAASLLVISDGEFTDPPEPEVIAERFLALKNAFRGKNLDAYFVVLHHKRDLREVIEAQGIRRQLLTVFNGSPDAGRVDIHRADNVFPGLKRVITQLSGTDLGDEGGVISRQGARIDLKPPFSISRLKIIIPAEDGAAPIRFTGAGFDLQRPPELFQPATRAARARVYHIEPREPLLPGSAPALTFDRPLPADTQVLFASGLDLELHFFDAGGNPLQPDAQGRLAVGQGVQLEVRATLQDRLNPRPVDLTALPHDPVFTLHQGDRTLPMALDKPQNYASARIDYPEAGQYTLTAVVRYPGFITRRSRDVTIEVKPVYPVKLSIAAERLDGCEPCEPLETRLTYTDQADFQDLFALEPMAEQAPGTGEYVLDTNPALPAGVRLAMPDGQTRDGTLALEPGVPVRLRLQYNQDYRGQDQQTIRFVLRPARTDWRGKAELALVLAPYVPPLRLDFAGHTGTDSERPFRLPLTGLDRQEGVYVAAENLFQPLDPERLELAGSTLDFSYEPAGAQRILVIPRKRWWCDCLTPAGEHEFTVRYSEPQLNRSAAYTGMVTLMDVPWWEKCWQELLVLLAVLLVVLKIICLLRTERFPSSSRLVVIDMDEPGSPRRIRLHSRWSTLLSCRDERRRGPKGLQLRAAGGGAAIVHNPRYRGGLYFDMSGESLIDSFEHYRRDVHWPWDWTLKDEELRQEYVLVKDIGKYSAGGLIEDF